MVKKGRSERSDATPFLTNKISLKIFFLYLLIKLTDKIVFTCKLHISVGSDKGALQRLHRDMLICFIS